MATLTGKITDVTGMAPDSISSITVKAPSVRVGSGADVIVSSPATVDFNRATGDITINGLTGGLSWLYIEGDGWSDSIALAVAEGMVTLVEAIANAVGVPGMADYISLLANLENAVDEVAQDAVDEAVEEIKWSRGNIPIGTASLDELEPGSWGVSYHDVRSALNLPGTWGNILMQKWGASGTSLVAIYTDVGTDSRPPKTWVAYKTGGVWSGWTEIAKTYDLATLGAPTTAWESSGVITNVPQGELYLEQLSSQLFHVSKEVVGQTFAGVDINALVIGDKTKPVVLVESGMHGNEPGAREGVLAWMRKAAQYRTWMDHLCLVVIPTVNVDRIGHNRLNLQYLDINRDFSDFATPEAQAISNAFDIYNPVFFISCHEFHRPDLPNEIQVGTTDFDIVDDNVRAASVQVKSSILQALGDMGADAGSYIMVDDYSPGRTIQTAQTWAAVEKSTPVAMIEVGGSLYPTTMGPLTDGVVIGVHPARYEPPMYRRIELLFTSLNAAMNEIVSIQGGDASGISGAEFQTLGNVDSRLQKVEKNIQKSFVNSDKIQRIVTSADPDEPISDGELLLVHTAPDVFFQSFTNVRNTSPRWAAGVWDVVEDSTANGSLALRGSGSSGRRLASVGGAAGLKDVEVVSRIKISNVVNLGRYGGLALRASGETGNETGYLALVSGTGLHISKLVNGSNVELNSAELTVPVNGWYWLRFRAHGTELSAKLWSDGQTEPEGWSVTANDNSVPVGGWLGPMLSTTSFSNFWDVIGVANLVTGNEIAPREE